MKQYKDEDILYLLLVSLGWKWRVNLINYLVKKYEPYKKSDNLVCPKCRKSIIPNSKQWYTNL